VGDVTIAQDTLRRAADLLEELSRLIQHSTSQNDTGPQRGSPSASTSSGGCPQSEISPPPPTPPTSGTSGSTYSPTSDRYHSSA
jgi:hypothetical protein